MRKNGPAFNATNKFSTNTLLINILNLNKLLTTNIMWIVYTVRYQGNKAGYNISLFYKKKYGYFYTSYRDVSLSTIVTFNTDVSLNRVCDWEFPMTKFPLWLGGWQTFGTIYQRNVDRFFSVLSIYVSLMNRLKSSLIFKIQKTHIYFVIL